MALGERIFAVLIRAYPRDFRERYGPELMAFFREERRHPRYGTGPLRPVRFWAAALRDVAHAVRAQRRADPAHPFAAVRFDVGNAVRSLAATPAVTVTALAVLALGLGIGTAVFSLVDGVVFRALPFPDADRLVAIQETVTASGRPVSPTYQSYADWAERQDVFTVLGASDAPSLLTTTDAERPQQLRAMPVSPELFDALGVRPALGARFTRERVQRKARVALISDALWRRRFSADPAVVGRTIAVDTGPYEVAGVMPPGFVYPIGTALMSSVDLWIPYVPPPGDRLRGDAHYFTLRVVGRLKPGVSLEQASARMTQIRDGLAAAYPDWSAEYGVLVQPLKNAIVPKTVRSWLLMLLAGAAGVLLVACANISNLLLTRVGGRAREIGIRAALGATRWQLVRGLMIESLVLTLAGTVGGLAVAYGGLAILRAALPSSLPRIAGVALDLRVVAAAAAGAIVTGVLCGLVPALQLSAADVAVALCRARTSTGRPARQRARTIFLIAEIAMTAVLLVGAGVFTSSFVRLIRTEMGFDPHGLMAVRIRPKLPAGASNAAAVRETLSRASTLLPDAVERVRAVPGVASAAVVAGGAPLTGTWNASKIDIGAGLTEAKEVVVKDVSGGYLEMIGARLVEGRTILDSDTRDGPPVVVINDAAAAKYFGPQNPIGRTISLDGDVPRTIVGLVRAMRLTGPESELQPEAYVPYAQSISPFFFGGLVVRTASEPTAVIFVTLVVRTTGDQSAIGAGVKDAIWSIFPDASIPDPESFEQLYAGLVAQRKLNMMLLAMFGGLALVIAAIGVYGVFACLVDQRTKEIGVRMALGAIPRRLVWTVAGRAASAVGAGLALGFLFAASLEYRLMPFVYSGIPHDPVVYGGAACLVLALGGLAAWIPARRAARVDPLVAIRAE